MVTRGRLDLAIVAYRRAAELEPLAPYVLWDLAWELMHIRHYGEALTLVERAAALTPTVEARLIIRRAQLLLELGRKAEAEAALRAYLAGPLTKSALGFAHEAVWCLKELGSPADREHWTAELLRQYPDSYPSGVILLMLGREEEAYPLLEKIHTIFLQQLYWAPAFDPVRDTPRFRQLLEKLGCAAEYKVARETLARMLKEQEAKK
jgi:tetratricopeptide (TPR) repeat protein